MVKSGVNSLFSYDVTFVLLISSRKLNRLKYINKFSQNSFFGVNGSLNIKSSRKQNFHYYSRNTGRYILYIEIPFPFVV